MTDTPLTGSIDIDSETFGSSRADSVSWKGGIDGSQLSGLRGPRGEKGDKGEPGPQGPPGPPGPPLRVAISHDHWCNIGRALRTEVEALSSERKKDLLKDLRSLVRMFYHRSISFHSIRDQALNLFDRYQLTLHVPAYRSLDCTYDWTARQSEDASLSELDRARYAVIALQISIGEDYWTEDVLRTVCLLLEYCDR